jgi:predicted RNase H-like nuclease (RuvC/YqgF family)
VNAELLGPLQDLVRKLLRLTGDLEGLLAQAREPEAELERLRARLASADVEARKAVATATNTLEREWSWRVQKLELEQATKVALLEQELKFLREGRSREQGNDRQ